MIRKKIEVSCGTIDVAKTIVNRCLKRGYQIYPKKLGKMMVIAYGEYLVKTGKRLFDSKITVSEKGVAIKEIDEIFSKIKAFDILFPEEKMFLNSEEILFTRIVEVYGEKNLLYINDDKRLKKLEANSKIRKNISDKKIFEAFADIPITPIDTPVLCSASEKAKWIINGCLEMEYDINTFKLEKLLVLAYGEYLVKTGEKLFNENIVIWDAGPMIREVDRDFMSYAMGFHSPLVEYYPKLDDEVRLVTDILDKYGKMDGFELNSDKRLKALIELKDSDDFIADASIESVFLKH